jgi:hypothetical protein
MLALVPAITAAAHHTPGQCADVRDGLVSWWPAEGTAEDIWNGNDGELKNGAGFTGGMVGQAFDFSGSLDHVRVPDDPSIGFTADDSYTIEFWIKTDGVTEGHPALVEKWTNVSGYPFAVRLNTGDPTIAFRPKGTIFCGAFDGTTPFPVADSIQTVDDDQFHHVACVYDHPSNSIEVYIDGQPDGTETYTSLGDISNGQDLYFGIRGNFNSFTEFDRTLDEISIYDRALSRSEIEAIYEAGSAGKCRAIAVDIDVKPGSDKNSINLNGHGVIPVAINGSADFSVLEIDFGSLLFEGLKVGVKGNQGPQCGIEDWNQDGYLDAVCHFEDDPSLWLGGETIATLTGHLLDGTEIEGSDTIRLVPKRSKKNKRR